MLETTISSSSSRDVNEDSDSAWFVSLTEFHLSNNIPVKLLLEVGQDINVKSPLMEVYTKHRDAFVTSSEKQQYQVGFEIFSVTVESEDVSILVSHNYKVRKG